MSRILVIDDHDRWRDLLSDILGQFGHQVVTAADRRTAIERLDESLSGAMPFDLVTLDHDLEDSSGNRMGMLESQVVLERLKTYPWPIGVVVISGRADSTAVRDYFRHYGLRDQVTATGIVDLDFIDKSDFAVQSLKTVLESMLDAIATSGRPPESGARSPAVAANSAPPAATSVRTKVFISYSHKDKIWLDELQITLKPMIRSGTIDVWDDQRIRAGQKWRVEIEKALAEARVAVLLVSRNLLASEFISTTELPSLLHAAEQEGVTILWIPVSASGVNQTELSQYQAAHDPTRPLDSLTNAELSEVLVRICETIQSAASG